MGWEIQLCKSSFVVIKASKRKLNSNVIYYTSYQSAMGLRGNYDSITLTLGGGMYVLRDYNDSMNPSSLFSVTEELTNTQISALDDNESFSQVCYFLM